MYALYAYVLFDEVTGVSFNDTSTSEKSECRNRLIGPTAASSAIAVPSA